MPDGVLLKYEYQHSCDSVILKYWVLGIITAGLIFPPQMGFCFSTTVLKVLTEISVYCFLFFSFFLCLLNDLAPPTQMVPKLGPVVQDANTV